jgi:hypothetical protein
MKQFIPFRVNWPGLVVVVLALALLGYCAYRGLP